MIHVGGGGGPFSLFLSGFFFLFILFFFLIFFLFCFFEQQTVKTRSRGNAEDEHGKRRTQTRRNTRIISVMKTNAKQEDGLAYIGY